MISAGAQSFLGEKLEFPIPGGSSLSVCPSGDHLAVVSRFACMLFVADKENDRWLGPFSAPNGGFFGTQENLDADAKSRRRMPLYTWTQLSNGQEALLLNPVSKRAVALFGQRALETTTSNQIEWQLLDAQTGRLRKFGADAPRNVADKLRAVYLDIRGHTQATESFVSQNDSVTVNLPDMLHGIADFSPQHDRVLYRPTRDDPLVSLNLKTGELIPFPIHKRNKGLGRHMGGSFSPDGEYVLQQTSYGHLDHYAGGFLTLYSKDGKFLEEVANFHDDVPSPVGFHEWLNNNWIVYSTGRELVFRKFVAR